MLGVSGEEDELKNGAKPTLIALMGIREYPARRASV